MGEGLGVTFLDLWRAELHAGKELRAKLVGLPGSAVEGAEADTWTDKLKHERLDGLYWVIFRDKAELYCSCSSKGRLIPKVCQKISDIMLKSRVLHRYVLLQKWHTF